MVGDFGQDICGLLPYFVTFLFSFILPSFEIKSTVLWTDTLVGRNESDWSIFLVGSPGRNGAIYLPHV